MQNNKDINLRSCKKCLLQDLSDLDLLKTVQDYIDRIDPDIKAPEQLYKERLECCRLCDKLLSGTCRACGCFVEMRAAVTNNHCPMEEW